MKKLLFLSTIFLALILTGCQQDGMGFSPSSEYNSTITVYLSSTATTINVATTNDRDGNALSLSATNKGYFTIEPGDPSKSERIVCTGVSSNTLTGCTRGLVASDASDESGDSSLASAHNVGAIIIMSNSAQFYGNYMNLWDNQTATGTKTFVSYPQIQTYVAPTDDKEFATKKYIDDIAIQGAATSTTSTTGISRLGTATQIASTTFDVDVPTVIPTSQSTSTPYSDSIGAGYVCVTEDDGNISSDCLPLNESLTFSATTTLATTTVTQFTSASTTLNGIIKIDYSTASTAPASVGYGNDNWANNPLGANLDGTYFSYPVSTANADVWLSSDTTVDYSNAFVKMTANVDTWTLYTHLLANNADASFQFDSGKDITVEFMARWTNSGGGDGHAGLGTTGGGMRHRLNYNTIVEGITFAVDGTTLYAANADGTTATTTDISSGITLSNWNLYKFVWDNGTDIKFYINGALKATHTTNMPASAIEAPIGFGGTTNLDFWAVGGINVTYEL